MKIIIPMFVIFILSLVIICITFSNSNSYRKLELLSIKMCEQAYFEGQKDAINNDVRIKLDKDSIYQWTESPWNNNRTPLFQPSLLDTK